MGRLQHNGLNLNNQRIQGMADGSAATDAVTKQQLDAIARGLDWKNSVRVATTTAITQSGTQTIDGQALIVGDRVLDKDHGTAALRGIWAVQAGAWIRATDFDDSIEVTAAAAVPVEAGTVNGDKVFILTTDGAITVGTTGLTFSLLGGSGTTYSAGNGLALAGSVFSVNAGSGIIADGTSTRIDPAYAGLAGRFVQNVGDGVATSITVTHGLGTFDVDVTVYNNTAPREDIEVDVQRPSTTQVTLIFGTAPTSNQYRVKITN